MAPDEARELLADERVQGVHIADVAFDREDLGSGESRSDLDGYRHRLSRADVIVDRQPHQ